MKLAVRERNGYRGIGRLLSVGGIHRTVCNLLPGRSADKEKLVVQRSRR